MTACGLTPAWVVADIGAGPGNLSRLFLDHGNPVVAVEPNREMREAANACSATTPLPGRRRPSRSNRLPNRSVDLVVAGQAFHGSTERRPRPSSPASCSRPVGPSSSGTSGARAVTPFLEAYEYLLLAHGTDYAAVRHQGRGGRCRHRGLFRPSGFEKARFDNLQTFDLLA
jgi:hypothetical protein